MRRRFAAYPLLMVLFAPALAFAQNPHVLAPKSCADCASAAEKAQSEGLNAASMGDVDAEETGSEEPYQGPRTVPPVIAHKAALLAIMLGRDPRKVRD